MEVSVIQTARRHVDSSTGKNYSYSAFRLSISPLSDPHAWHTARPAPLSNVHAEHCHSAPPTPPSPPTDFPGLCNRGGGAPPPPLPAPPLPPLPPPTPPQGTPSVTPSSPASSSLLPSRMSCHVSRISGAADMVTVYGRPFELGLPWGDSIPCPFRTRPPAPFKPLRTEPPSLPPPPPPLIENRDTCFIADRRGLLASAALGLCTADTADSTATGDATGDVTGVAMGGITGDEWMDEWMPARASPYW